jgi:hypothetical protein
MQKNIGEYGFMQIIQIQAPNHHEQVHKAKIKAVVATRENKIPVIETFRGQ